LAPTVTIAKVRSAASLRSAQRSQITATRQL
jgi:hypothetical protein